MNQHRFRSRTAAAGLLLIHFGLLCACSRSASPDDAAVPRAPSNARVFRFEDGTPGSSPPGFTAALTGGGGPVRWEIQEAADAPPGGKVAAQLSADKTDARYPHLVRDDVSASDVDVSVRFKTLRGEIDASAGLVFRYLDADNYYVVRANALESNVVAYKTENGRRSSIGVKGDGGAYGVEAEVPHEQWNSLRVIARGRLFEIFLNGTKLFEVENVTFTEAGKVGLWTKADAVTQFDDFTVVSIGK